MTTPARFTCKLFLGLVIAMCVASCAHPRPSRLTPVQRYQLLKGACASGDERAVEILLEVGASPDGGPDWVTDALWGKYGDEFSSPLTAAAYHGHLDIMKLLLKHGAHVDLLEGEGLTSLSLAISARQRAAVELLLEAGADPTQSFVERHLAACDDAELVARVRSAIAAWKNRPAPAAGAAKRP